LKKQLGIASVAIVMVAALFTLAAVASDGSVYLSSDKNGQNRVTSIQEGDTVFVVVIDNDENDDCDVRDKFWADIKILDPKTGAMLDWESWAAADVVRPVRNYVGRNGNLGNGHYLEETGADTGVFVSNRSFQIGRRLAFAIEQGNTHWVGADFDGFDLAGAFWHTNQGDFEYNAGVRWNWNRIVPAFPAGIRAFVGQLEGKFENLDTLIVMYQDQNDPTDVAVSMAKIIDTTATISWDKTLYKDANTSATITVVDPDENLNCDMIEWVPVFVIVNPGSWNPIQTNSANDFCSLKRLGGVAPAAALPAAAAAPIASPVRGAIAGWGSAMFWFNIYNSGSTQAGVNLVAATPVLPAQPDDDGSWYLQYPNAFNSLGVGAVGDGRGAIFNTRTRNGETRVSFYAQETGPDTGVFQLNLNSILLDLGFVSLDVGDVLVAYYLDPNDEDDFVLATAYIESRDHVSYTMFTDAAKTKKSLFWIGRDPVYVQVVDYNANMDPCCREQVVVNICDVHEDDDVEWLLLDETADSSGIFFTNAGTRLWPVWDALGVGNLPGATGGYQLNLDNWILEVYNEDSVYARYNDVYYFAVQSAPGLNDGLAFLGDSNILTAFPPIIERIRKANDVSFDLMKIADTQVYNGSATQMWFLDRKGTQVEGYVNSDCVFIKVIDPDQDEDQLRRERVNAFWDANQNFPFGPMDDRDNHAVCGIVENWTHPVNHLLGDTNIFSGPSAAVQGVERVGPSGFGERPNSTRAKVYILNPRNGHWAPVDLLETGVATGEFVSLGCIELGAVYQCVPTLDIRPGDTIVAFYQDPSNHSDSAMISIKVGLGGGGTPPTQQSTTMFVNVDGAEVANYTDADLVYVKVIDPSHTGEATLVGAVEIDGVTYDLTLVSGDVFKTAGLDLDLEAGDSITATYTDPTDPTDTSDDMVTIVGSALSVIRFFAGPSPFSTECTFGYEGTGVATTMTVEIRDLTGKLVWAQELTSVTEIVWNGKDASGAQLANGAYMYWIYATDGTNPFKDTGKVFINR